jgi:hypothetical protein
LKVPRSVSPAPCNNKQRVSNRNGPGREININLHVCLLPLSSDSGKSQVADFAAPSHRPWYLVPDLTVDAHMFAGFGVGAGVRLIAGLGVFAGPEMAAAPDTAEMAAVLAVTASLDEAAFLLDMRSFAGTGW